MRAVALVLLAVAAMAAAALEQPLDTEVAPRFVAESEGVAEAIHEVDEVEAEDEQEAEGGAEADTEADDEDSGEPVEEGEEQPEGAAGPRVFASLSSRLARAADGLLSWWGPSQATVDGMEQLAAEEGVGAHELWARAAERLYSTGADLHDLHDHEMAGSSSRFAEVEDGVSLHSALHAQLSAQATRAAEAAERRSQAAVSANGGEVCRAIVAAIRKYRNANARGGSGAIPPFDEISGDVVKTVGGNVRVSDVDKLWAITVHRLLYRGGSVDDTCNSNALALALRAAARTQLPVGGALSDFAMGLEEEYSDVRMNPDSENVAGLAVSGNVPLPRVAPYMKICPDHTMPPKGYPRGQAYGVIEVATGPLPISWEARAAHRAVTERWRAPLPKPVVLKEGSPMGLERLTRAFNRDLPAELKNYFMPVEKLRSDASEFAITNYPNENMPINSIQTNFEASLCALYKNANFLALNKLPGQRDLWIAARQAATEYVSGTGPNRMHAVSAAEIASLPAQQICELHGLFTVMFLHGAYWGAQAGAQVEGKSVGQTIHPYGGTPKNFFSVMVKTNVRDIVDRLPFPASDVMHTFYESSLGSNRARVRLAMHTLLTAAMKGKHWTVATYAGDVINWRAPAKPDGSRPAASPLRPWLAADGAYMDAVIRAAGARPLYKPTACSPIGDRAPPASVYRDPMQKKAEQQIVVVCEARFQTEPLNRAMTIQMADPPGSQDRETYARSLVDQLKSAVSQFERDGPNHWSNTGIWARNAPSKPATSTPAPAKPKPVPSKVTASVVSTAPSAHHMHTH